MRKAFETAVILAGTVGWWGFVYPESSLVQEETCISCEKDESENIEEYKDADSKKRVVQKSVCGEDIRIKSWIWEYVCQVKEENKDVTEMTECEENTLCQQVQSAH